MEEAEELHGDKQGHSSSQGAIMGPGDIGPKKGKTAKKQAKKSDDIWDVDEVPEEDLNFGVDEGDTRPEPDYTIAYKQAVRSEDMFLGIDGKDAGSHCCEDLIVTIKLPGVSSLESISLDVTKNTLRASTPKFRLAMYLPHTVRDQDGNAKWDSDKSELRLTLPIDHKVSADSMLDQGMNGFMQDILDLPDREEILDKYRDE